MIDWDLIERNLTNGTTYADIKCSDCELYIMRRPSYCDRGRYQVGVKSNDVAKLTVDDADGFPRMYFLFENMKSEVEQWMKARNQEPLETKVCCI